MSHEIAKTAGRDAFAFAGEVAWHGLGQLILPTDDLDTIVEKGGLNWDVLRADVRYTVNVDGRTEERAFENRSVLYRGDTGEALSVQSDSRYNIHQPRDIAEFFRGFLASHKLSIETIGALKGGRIVWALAKLNGGHEIKSPDGSKVFPYVRLQTSFDGSRATSLDATTIRQVCANTELAVEDELARDKRRSGRVQHTEVWSDAVVKRLEGDFERLGEKLENTSKVWHQLAARPLKNDEAKAFFATLLGINLAEVGKVRDGKQIVSAKQQGQLDALLAAYQNAPGAVPGSAFGALQAVTYYVDHQSIVRDTAKDGTAGARIASSQFGVGAQLKDRARAELLELAA